MERFSLSHCLKVNFSLALNISCFICGGYCDAMSAVFSLKMRLIMDAIALIISGKCVFSLITHFTPLLPKVTHTHPDKRLFSLGDVLYKERFHANHMCFDSVSEITHDCGSPSLTQVWISTGSHIVHTYTITRGMCQRDVTRGGLDWSRKQPLGLLSQRPHNSLHLSPAWLRVTTGAELPSLSSRMIPPSPPSHLFYYNS